MSSRRSLSFGCRLDRYVGMLFVSSYATALLLVLGLFVILDLGAHLDDYLEQWKDGSTVRTSILVRYYLLNLPYLFLQVAPFVTLLAAMFTVNRMLRKNEVAAVLSAGVSAHRLLLPVFVAGGVLAVGMFSLREVVGWGIAEKRDRLFDVLENERYVAVYEDLVVDDLSGSIVVMRDFRPDPPDGKPPTITGFTAILRTEAGVTIRIEANRAFWKDGRWVLGEGKRTVIGEAKSQEAVTELEGFEFTPKLALTYRRARDNPLELSFSEVEDLMRRDPDNIVYQTLWHYHLTFPLANLVLLLVGIPVLFSYERGRGTDRMALGGLLCIFYFGVEFVFRSLGLEGALSPILASWIPVLACGSFGVVLYDGVRT